ncbi:MAG: DUF3482 domain-containing protein [Usitatibacter sp.]
MSVQLSIVAHTNVGKTALVRTLLKRDIGEVADRPHVTEAAERHALLDTPQGDLLYLWDTPGFGDSARLAKRLRASGNPLAWLQTQVWDRLADRPFFCSQQAVRNVRDESDVVLYLVNGAEDPSSVGYIAAELAILEWTGKPVLLLLNQVGPPRSRDAEKADEERWSHLLAAHVAHRDVITLDAFARCWVQEDRLLRAAGALLDAEKGPEMERLRAAWRSRNLAIFRASMNSMAQLLAATLVDRELVPERLDAGALAQRALQWIARARSGQRGTDSSVDAAMEALVKRFDERVRDDTERLIALHGLGERALQRILARTAGQFEVAMPADVAGTGFVGGVLTGAAGGLAADLSAGGLTLGAGMLVGAILGALGAGGAARAYNILQGQEDGRVRWTPELLAQQARAALLRYLAIAHYGRGRGDWSEGEAPSHWLALVDAEVRARQGALVAAGRMAADGEGEVALAAHLEPELAAASSAILTRLYPEAREVF